MRAKEPLIKSTLPVIAGEAGNPVSRSSRLEINRYAHPFGAALRVFRARKLACAKALRASR